MIITGEGRVYLEKGEVAPVVCVCGHIYQPPEGSYSSECPKCHVRIRHDAQEWKVDRN